MRAPLYLWPHQSWLEKRNTPARTLPQGILRDWLRSADRSQAIHPELPFFLEGFAIVGGDLLNAAHTLFDEDHFAQCAVSRSQIKGLVIGRFVDRKNNDILVVRGRNIKSLHLGSRAYDALHDRAFVFFGKAQERRKVRRKFGMRAFLQDAFHGDRHSLADRRAGRSGHLGVGNRVQKDKGEKAGHRCS